ncbi:uncharacterized protein LOC135683591 isoform X2 [Rhopilema esculentum]|uniref:uncharacterized protein LOC135683591 isoform X2 n=1 Tax=Rhopilema esculentum TaxID=499914 RepID=UPI0031D96592
MELKGAKVVFLYVIFRHISKMFAAGPDFYKLGNGFLAEGWLSSKKYSFESFTNIPDFPGCPSKAINGADFEIEPIMQTGYQYWRYRAIFTSSQTGKHKFFALCSTECQIFIQNGKQGTKKVLEVNATTANDWADRKWSDEVILLEGFRYEILVHHFGAQSSMTFFKLGVKFPDLTEQKPINSTNLRRSMEHYKWDGLLAQRYTIEHIKVGQPDAIDYVYSNNPSYPGSPTAFGCKSTLFDSATSSNGDKFAILYTGYVKVPFSAFYSFTIHLCDDLCDLFMTKNNLETSIVRNKSPVISNASMLSANTLYPIKLFFGEQSQVEIIQIKYTYLNNSFLSWSGMLYNLKTGMKFSSNELAMRVARVRIFLCHLLYENMCKVDFSYQ